jgi:hypothetical protein
VEDRARAVAVVDRGWNWQRILDEVIVTDDLVDEVE